MASLALEIPQHDSVEESEGRRWRRGSIVIQLPAINRRIPASDALLQQLSQGSRVMFRQL
jgi:hypothetical protein